MLSVNIISLPKHAEDNMKYDKKACVASHVRNVHNDVRKWQVIPNTFMEDIKHGPTHLARWQDKKTSDYPLEEFCQQVHIFI